MPPPAALLLLFVGVLAPLPGPASAACTPPYEAQPGAYALRVVPGQTLDVAGNLTVAAGTRVLLEGTTRVAGGVIVRGELFLSSAASSTLTADWVVVEAGGVLTAGSEACPVPPTVTSTILLHNGTVYGTAGRKALMVLAGGSLEVSEAGRRQA